MYDEFDHEDTHLPERNPDPVDSEIKEAENVTPEELHAEEIGRQSEVYREEAGEAAQSELEKEQAYQDQAEIVEARQEPGSSAGYYQDSEGQDGAGAGDSRIQSSEQVENQYGSSHQEYQTHQNTYHYQSQKPAPLKEHGKVANRGIGPKLAIAAAVALVFGVVSSVSYQATNYIGDKAFPKETEKRIESTGSVGAGETEDKDTKQASAVPISAGNVDVRQVVKNTMPSIVAITTVSVQEVQDMFFGTTRQEESEGSGSGIIVDQNDTELLIATNNHVVEGAKVLSVCFTVDVDNSDDLVVTGQIKGTDPEKDLAIVAVQLKDIPDSVKNQIKVVETGDSDHLEVGEQVVAIGNALGYGQSVTVGYVSALDREVTVDNSTNKLIQTDAAINFGNSGGALLNTSGQLIGINSVKAAATGVEGMGYAIPINTAKPILSDLMNRATRNKVDQAEQGYMGVQLSDVSEEAIQIYNMPKGAFVYSVIEGSAAEKAGLAKGDIITKIDGVSVSSRDDVLSRMEYYKAGETIDIIAQTANSGEYVERTVTITLGERPAEESSQNDQQQANPGGQQDGGNQLTPFQDMFPEQFGQR